MKKVEAKIKAEDAKKKEICPRRMMRLKKSNLEQKLSEITRDNSKESDYLEQLYDEVREVTKDLHQKLEIKTQELVPLQQ
jgi:hypothetical protein